MLNLERYPGIGKEIGELVASKQQQYGDSFGKSGKILRILYPNGIPLTALEDALVIVRVIDKLFRIATAAGNFDAGNENPWQDLAGYAILAVKRNEQAQG